MIQQFHNIRETQYPQVMNAWNIKKSCLTFEHCQEPRIESHLGQACPLHMFSLAQSPPAALSGWFLARAIPLPSLSIYCVYLLWVFIVLTKTHDCTTAQEWGAPFSFLPWKWRNQTWDRSKVQNPAQSTCSALLFLCPSPLQPGETFLFL